MSLLFNNKQDKTFARGSTASIKTPVVFSLKEGKKGSKLQIEFFYEVRNTRGVLQW